MLVWRRQPDLRDLFVSCEDRPAHLPEALLQRKAVDGGELLDQHLPNARVQDVPVTLRADVAPASGQRRGQHPVVSLRKCGVPVMQESGELRPGRLQQHEITEPGQHPGALLASPAFDRHRRSPGLLTGPDEGVRMTVASNPRALPPVLVDVDPRATYWLDLVGEVPGQR